MQLRDLASETFVGFAEQDGPGFESVVTAACQESGFVPRFAQSASQMQSILALGHGMALVPAAMAAVHLAGTAYVQLRQRTTAVRYTVAIAWNPQNENAALHAFIAMVDRLGTGVAR